MRKSGLLIVFILGLTFGGCGGGKGSAPAIRSVTIKGSDTMVILGQRWAETYMKEHPDKRIQVTGGYILQHTHDDSGRGAGAGLARGSGPCDTVPGRVNHEKNEDIKNNDDAKEDSPEND